MPGEPFFGFSLGLLALSGLLFLFSLNYVLQRLGEMLPDEALRHETRQYTAVNRTLLVVLLWVAALYVGLAEFGGASAQSSLLLAWLNEGGLWALVFLVLLPLAMTMALVWKTKEVILDSVFK